MREADRAPGSMLLVLVLLAPALAGCVGDDGGNGADAGTPRFHAVMTLPLGGTLVPAHLDADGALDIVVAGSAGVTRVDGVKDGWFGTPRTLLEGADVTALAVGSVRSENASDVIAWRADGGAVVLTDAGDGATTSLPGFPRNVHAAAPVDLDNDGALDVAAATDEGLVVAFSADDFANHSRVTDRATHGFTFLFANDDMRFDLVTLHADGLALFTHDDEENGTLVPQPAHALPAVADPVTVVPLDHNNDQRSDALVATQDGLVLLENAGRARYRDATADAGLPTSGAWRSAVAFDADNDGFEDVLALTANGALRLYVNAGDGTFTARAATTDDAPPARALVAGDFDRDGRVDVLGVSEDETTVFANRDDAGHWLSLDLVGKESNADGIGAKLTLSTSTFIMYRQTGGVGSPAAALAPDAHFGLGAEPANKYALAILWPSGTLQFDETESLDLMDRHVVAVESEQDAPWNVC